MTPHAWVDEFPAAITVSDAKGTIIEMNAKAAKTLEKDGGGEAHRHERPGLPSKAGPVQAPGHHGEPEAERLHDRKGRGQKTLLPGAVV